MQISLTAQQLHTAGLNSDATNHLLNEMNAVIPSAETPDRAWQLLSSKLTAMRAPFAAHLLLFSTLFPKWHTEPDTAPGWVPSTEIIHSANITAFMAEQNFTDVKLFQQWTTQHYETFWERITNKLQIVFSAPYSAICDVSNGLSTPNWFPQAKLNIADSCFTAPGSATALIYENTNNELQKMSYSELNQFTNQIANSLIVQGYVAGDAIGIAMPMNFYAVAIYLGIIKMGGVVVSIADSFSADEIALRLKIAKARAIFTQDFTDWGNKQIPLYSKVQQIEFVNIITLPCAERVTIPLRAQDCTWQDFLVANNVFTATPCDPMSACNILFSSGTTGIPKAIVWNHTTAIKAASDGYFHQNIKVNDVLAWPTNLGWMMGPWLIFAALLNHGSIALNGRAPKDRAFGEFIARARVNILGVVPTLVANWRETKCMENLDWDSIKVFSSTGECSNPEDMLYLMSLAGYKPVIEYCGGTEIGGAYISSTVITNNYPSLFTTATVGLDFIILDEQGQPSDIGEVAIIPPSIGLSTQLLNANHEETYFAKMPRTQDGKLLRRHGDQIKQFPSGCYCILGRVDDTMKLGGIKISAAEIERVIIGIPHIIEVAAIAIPPKMSGPALLVIYASAATQLDKTTVMKEMQSRISKQLNPLFKIHDVVITNELPKTASNKIMRRVLRNNYKM